MQVVRPGSEANPIGICPCSTIGADRSVITCTLAIACETLQATTTTNNQSDFVALVTNVWPGRGRTRRRMRKKERKKERKKIGRESCVGEGYLLAGTLEEASRRLLWLRVPQQHSSSLSCIRPLGALELVKAEQDAGGPARSLYRCSSAPRQNIKGFLAHD